MDVDLQDTSAQSAQPQKFLRYRSVRKAASHVLEPQNNPPPPMPEIPQTSLTRLPSRYHRRPPTTQSAPPLVPQLPSSHDHATVPRTRGKTFDGVIGGEQKPSGENGGRRMIIQHSGSRPGTRQPTSKATSRKTLTSSEEVPEPKEIRRSYEAAREEARLILEGEHDRLKVLRQKEAKRRQQERERRRQEEERANEEARQHEAETNAKREAEEATRLEAKLLAAQKRQKPGRNAESAEQEENTPVTKPQQDSKRSRMRTLVIGGTSSTKPDKYGHHRRAASAVDQLRAKPQEHHARNNSASRIDEVPLDKPDPKPNFDAPVSAVNAGERRVSVKCRDAFITLPIQPSTTVKDILNSASLCMSESIDPKSAVLLESFSQLGLERPLRRYERIRDVMNSWDNDAQNHLFIMGVNDCAAPGLQVVEVPHQQPFGTTVQIYHSQKPGKWDKRWLKLREDGQITTSKNENSIDSTNICHISDFDLYAPTARQLKKLKPPKKLCYALKSQEKSAMFLSGANFVHFFSTKDKEIADKWYHAVHTWRSWYLVNVLGEGQNRPAEPGYGQHLDNRPGTSNSKETLPYVLGSFKSLVDFSSGLEAGRSSQPDVQRPLIDFVPARPSVDEFSFGPNFAFKSLAAPPTAFPRNLMADTTAHVNGNDTDHAFTGTGLLGRSASRRTQGGSRTGHGVAGADGKPLVDLEPASDFTDGSLLRRMETVAARNGAFQPKIDRQKRKEVDVAVGEGF